jgi:hypothetical protein
MYKKYTYGTKTGTEALEVALKYCKSKIVIIPTYTCEDILTAVLNTGCTPVIVDCNKSLQIDPWQALKRSGLADTIIIPHMFGIQTPVSPFKNLNIKIIEDLSQCHGIPGLGKDADIVVSSTNKSKWLDSKEGGYVFSDNILPLEPREFKWDIEIKYQNRKSKAEELINAGVDLIGKDIPNSWLRGMYFTDSPKRKPYIPLHEIYGKFGCPTVDSYSNKIDWISIFDK